jgi:Tol biopolymer transport system component
MRSRLVARTDNSIVGAGDLVGVRTSGDTTPVELVSSPFTELHPAVSPDGHWLAYTSNESGRNEVYVRPFPNTNDGRWQVSTAGGIEPRWSHDGSELFFLGPPNDLLAARITTRPSFAVAGIQSLFDVSNYVIDAFHTSYAVTPDGRGFLFAAPLQGTGPVRTTKVIRVEGWFHDLRNTTAE